MTERLSNKCPCDKCGKDRKCELAQEACENYFKWEDDCIKKLAEYETAEEEGRLVVLPCKVGDVVYAIEDKYYEYLYHKGIQKGHVCRFEYDKEWFAWIHIDGCNKDLQIAYKTSNFNQTVFLTREEAEKALREMEKDDATN